MLSTKEIIEKTCTSKVSMSRKEADETIDRYAKQGRLFYYYKCSFCNRYHISKNYYTVEKVKIIWGKYVVNN